MRAPASSTTWASLALLFLASPALSIQLDVTDNNSILSAAKIVVNDLLQLYTANGTGPAIPGLLPRPYYFWEAGLMFDSLINYWSFSGDASVVKTIQEGMLFQVGPDYSYMPPNQSKSLGNDDQSSWGLAAMTAAEVGFPTATDQTLSWLQLAQRVFDSQVPRWDTSSCNGGLRWQIFTFNNGYNYKNSISNGNFLQLAARLARFTGNQTYIDWAQKTFDWSRASGLVNDQYIVFDGADDLLNCTEIDHVQWSMYLGVYMKASAYLANSTQQQSWSTTAASFLATVPEIFTTVPSIFAKNGNNPSQSANDSGTILYEVACQPQGNCNYDQKAFLGVLARALAQTRDLTQPVEQSKYPGNLRNQLIRSILQDSAKGAAASCRGGASKTLCGEDWQSGEWDGSDGVGQQLNALEVFLANLPGKTLLTANSSQSSTTVGGTQAGTSTTGARPAVATGSASGLPVGTSLQLIAMGVVSAYLLIM